MLACTGYFLALPYLPPPSYYACTRLFNSRLLATTHYPTLPSIVRLQTLNLQYLDPLDFLCAKKTDQDGGAARHTTLPHPTPPLFFGCTRLTYNSSTHLIFSAQKKKKVKTVVLHEIVPYPTLTYYGCTRFTRGSSLQHPTLRYTLEANPNITAAPASLTACLDFA